MSAKRKGCKKRSYTYPKESKKDITAVRVYTNHMIVNGSGSWDKFDCLLLRMTGLYIHAITGEIGCLYWDMQVSL